MAARRCASCPAATRRSEMAKKKKRSRSRRRRRRRAEEQEEADHHGRGVRADRRLRREDGPAQAEAADGRAGRRPRPSWPRPSSRTCARRTTGCRRSRCRRRGEHGTKGEDEKDGDKESTTTTTIAADADPAGPVDSLDAITINLAAGHYLKVGLALQLPAGVEPEEVEDDRELGSGRAQDGDRHGCRARRSTP